MPHPLLEGAAAGLAADPEVSRIIERELRERLRVEFDTRLPRSTSCGALSRGKGG